LFPCEQHDKPPLFLGWFFDYLSEKGGGDKNGNFSKKLSDFDVVDQ
jgi:hypothetical protein